MLMTLTFVRRTNWNVCDLAAGLSRIIHSLWWGSETRPRKVNVLMKVLKRPENVPLSRNTDETMKICHGNSSNQHHLHYAVFSVTGSALSPIGCRVEHAQNEVKLMKLQPPGCEQISLIRRRTLRHGESLTLVVGERRARSLWYWKDDAVKLSSMSGLVQSLICFAQHWWSKTQ